MEDTPVVPRLRLAEARNEKRWSQQEVAERIGTTHVNVSRWERGTTKPSPYFRRKLSKLFNKDEEELDLSSPTIRAEPATTPASSLSAPLPHPSPTIAGHEPLYDPIIPLRSHIDLVGREQELAQLKQRLYSKGSVALTALNGLPGVGKTSLAIALAHDEEVRGHFRDGILWVGLGIDPDIQRRLSRWATLLGISASEISTLSDDEARALALRAAIGERAMLLVVDDAWKVEDALKFKIGGPNCAHVVTTRFPHIALQIAGDGATVIEELSKEEGLALLKQLAPAVVEQEVQKAEALVQAVGGLPLALTLMGSYLRLQAYSGQRRRINTALERLSDVQGRLGISEPRGPIERHPSLPTDVSISLTSIISVTDQFLSEQARATLYALSVLPSKPDSFSEEAALAVAACPVEAIDEIIDAGLLESSGDGRYTLHQTIADYARLHLNGTAAQERLVAYAPTYVEAHKTDYELLDLESGTIITALDTAYALKRWDKLIQGVNAFVPFLLVRGNYSLAMKHVQRAHEAALAQGDQQGVASMLLYQGQIAQKLGDYDQAEAAFQEGLTIARQIGDRELTSAILKDLGWVTLKRGELALAEAYLQEGLALARQIQQKERISGLLTMLGTVATRKGDYTQSEIYLQEGLALARQIGDREQICLLLMNLGAMIAEKGILTQAEVYFREGLELARQIGHNEWTSALLSNLGFIAVLQGDYAQAERYQLEGLELAQQIGNREWISILLLNLGETAIAQGNYEKAEKYLQETLLSARQINRPQIIAKALYEYGNLYIRREQWLEAEARLREMHAVIPKGDQELLALNQYGLARVAAAQGNLQEAQALGEASATTLRTMGHRSAQEVQQWLDSIKH